MVLSGGILKANLSRREFRGSDRFRQFPIVLPDCCAEENDEVDVRSILAEPAGKEMKFAVKMTFKFRTYATIVLMLMSSSIFVEQRQIIFFELSKLFDCVKTSVLL